MPADGPEFDPLAILVALERHGVSYLVVGGFGAQAHGATRQTQDIDVVPASDDENFDRLAATLRALNARMRVGGLTDDEARQLPVVVDGLTIRSFGSSTWMTDAGPLDILIELRDRAGSRHGYDALASRLVANEIGGITVKLASLKDIVASKEFAGRDKDLEALPELRELLARLDADPPPE